MISVPLGVFSPTLYVYSPSENFGGLSLTSFKKTVTRTVENQEVFWRSAACEIDEKEGKKLFDLLLASVTLPHFYI